MELPEFLLARIAEDEAWAEANPHFADAPEWVPPFWTRVLAECSAKRRIVETYEEYRDDAEQQPHELWTGAEAMEKTLRLLALPYADHPDYREEWRP